MADFTVRVILHNGKSDDYIALHEDMRKAGFHRLIRGDKSITYQLPWAEYDHVSDRTNLEVLEQVVRIVKKVHPGFEETRDFGVLLTQGKQSWRGLKRVAK